MDAIINKDVSPHASIVEPEKVNTAVKENKPSNVDVRKIAPVK